MADLNRVQLLGNLTKDPEMKLTPSGKQVCSFGIATNKRYKDAKTQEWKSTPQYHTAVVWGKDAETISLLRKGAKVYLEGELSTRSWETPTGEKKYATEVQVKVLQPCSTPARVKHEQMQETFADDDTVSIEEIPW